MAHRPIYVDLDLNQNELQNAVAQNLASAPANPKKGQEYFDTTDNQKYIWNGTSWVSETSQGRVYSAGTGIDSFALSGGTIQVSTTIASKTDIGDAALTIQRNGSAIGTFTANATSAVTVNVSVPTTASDVGALPSTTTITDLITTTQAEALNSGVTSTVVAQVGTNATAISTINDKIPSQASSSNKLADKAYVDNAIQTNSAHFRGNWATWAAVPTSSSDYPADDDGNKTPTVNDYMVVQDASGYTDETLIGAWQFTYTGVWATNGKAGWLPRFQINEDPLTPAQQAALDSGVTSTVVAQVGTNTTAISNLQIDKQDKLTAGTNITISGGTISATDTTYSNGSGLSLTGTTFAVDFTAVATAAQGAKADTAAQVYSESNPALTASGGQCTWTVTHNLGSRNVEVKVYEISSWEEVVTSVALTSTSVVTVKLNSNSNIAAASYQVVVAGH